MDLSRLEKLLKKYNQPKFRIDQIKKAVLKDGASSFLEITTLSKELREVLDKEMNILSFVSDKILCSKDKQSIKASLKLKDDRSVETVLLSSKPGVWSACISTQVGCPLDCSFCATGQNKFKRNLTAEEITDQILFWRQYLKKSQLSNYHISNVVYMGMGEPFLNWENFKKSLDDLINPDLFGFGSRSISVSTCGIPEGIKKLARFFPQINLAISLHFADNQKRSRFMPINRKHSLDSLQNAIKEYFEISNRKVFIEYVMLRGINDGPQDAEKLINYLKSINKNYLLHVNLIRYYFTLNNFESSPKSRINKFRNSLLRGGINVTIRKSLGEEIQGACGQLSGR